MPPVDPKKDTTEDGAPVFKSYFDLLEAKYAEREESPTLAEASAEPAPEGPPGPGRSAEVAAVPLHPGDSAGAAAAPRRPPAVSGAGGVPGPEAKGAEAAPSTSGARPRPPSTARGPGGGRRKEGGQWLVTLLVLATLGVGFVGAMRWISKDWWQDGAGEPPAAEVEPTAPPAESRPAVAPPAEGDPAPAPSTPDAVTAAGGPAASPPRPADRPPPAAPGSPPAAPTEADGPAESEPIRGVASETATAVAPSEEIAAVAVPSPSVEDPGPAAAAPPTAAATATSDESVAVDSVGPRKVFAPQPSYPEAARRRGEQGVV
ncbi:MAG: hypothetical protein AAFX50_11350, partial [Acidobacteriota bacterium]